MVAGNELYASASIGISLFPQDADDAPTLAQERRGRDVPAKKAGPGGYALHVEDDADALSRASLTTRLRKAVENQDWKLHYQPMVDADGRLDDRRRGADPLDGRRTAASCRRASSSRSPRRWG